MILEKERKRDMEKKYVVTMLCTDTDNTYYVNMKFNVTYNNLKE